jgi:hypothetical protein
MSPSELAWRSRDEVRDAVDRCRVSFALIPSERAISWSDGKGDTQPGFRVSDVAPGEWAAAPPGSLEASWHRELSSRAGRILSRRLTFFNLRDRDLGDPIRWNMDHESGKRAPMGFAPSIDYRDFSVTGDAKLVWEPNRHQHLAVLGRAYRAGGEDRYAEGVVTQIESWIRQCPFGRGMNWRSPLELAIRLINWVWAIDLIRESGRFSGDFRRRFLHAAYLHLWEITRKYSRGSSGNNHRIGEAAGVFVATSYFPTLAGHRRWREESHRILSREILAQTYPDGFSREQATGYHLFVLEFFLVAGIAARNSGMDFPRSYWERLEKMMEYVAALSEGGENVPMTGDGDDGYLLDLGSRGGEVSALLCAGAVLFRRPDLKRQAGPWREYAAWLLGRSGRERFDGLDTEPPGVPLRSRRFPDSGIYLLQSGHAGASDRISVVFDCAELGLGSIAAHGHADALSFTLRAFGANVFVDPGTYDYFRYPEWRTYFRSTNAHNTLGIDDLDQSEMQGSFLWGARANSRCTRWEENTGGATVSGEHDGYMRLSDPVLHRRTMRLDGVSRNLFIRDELFGKGSHEISIRFHLSEECILTGGDSNRFEIRVGGGKVTLSLDPKLSVKTSRGCVHPITGWVSQGYHRKVPTTTIMGHASCVGNSGFECRVTVERK